MTGITVTNGIVCTAVWLALRYGDVRWRRWLLEGLIGALAVVATISALRQIDRWVYTLPPVDMSATAARIGNPGLASTFVPGSVASRVAGLPAAALASLVAPPAQRIRNELAEKNDNRYKFGYSFIESSVTPPRAVAAWILFIIGMVAGIPRMRISPLGRGLAALFAFNLALHSVWGLEVFLYSQHWIAFLVFAIVAGLDRIDRFGGGVALALGLAVASNSAWQFSAMLANLIA
jgi:hypothetical protein